MRDASSDVMLFFGGDFDALGLYLKLEERVLAEWPGVGIKVQKTQISFSNKRGFACVSRPRRKADTGIVVTFGLNRRESSPRMAYTVEPCPGRWTHHVGVSSPSEIDDELMAWLREAYNFSASKR